MRIKPAIVALLFTAAYFLNAFAVQAIPEPTSGNDPAAQNTDTGDFYTKLVTTYTVDQASNSRVKHEYSIRNLTPTTFIKQYALSTAYPNLSNIVVKENGREIEANITNAEHLTTIAITFPQDIVGENKVRNFTIEYTNPDLASIGGKSLEIHAPELSEPEQYNEHQVILITPIQFGNPVRSNPEPAKSSIAESGIRTEFANLQGKSLSVLFGDSQYYSLTLRYNLENPGTSEAFTQIALPPDTAFQKMHYQSLDPLPQEIKKDADGNWIAKYKIPASSILPVYLTANAKVTLEPRQDFKISELKPEHTKGTDYWEVRDSQVAAEAAKARTPEAIYNFVTEKLNYSYDFDEVGRRLGAAKSLDKPNEAVCQEFTDLFIAMARANNIPARRLTGFAYSQNNVLRPSSFNGDILHAWPEYYDNNKDGWVQVDPTWGNTTGGVDYFRQFDLNHIVFAINGISSSTPYPAGSYKAENEETKDVEVTFADSFPEVPPDFKIDLKPSTALGLPLPGFYTLSVTNNTGQAWYDITAKFDYAADKALVHQGENLAIPAILPFQTQNFTVTAHTPQWQIVKDFPVNITLVKAAEAEAGEIYESQQQNITAGPAVIGYFKNTEILIGVGAGLTVLTLVGGSILVFRRT